MLSGVTVVDPLTTFIEAGVTIGRDTVMHPMTVIHTDVRIGRNCSIGPMARIASRDPHQRWGRNREFCGGFADLRLGRGVMQKHFSFLGDAVVGSGS